MKKIFSSLLIAGALCFASCNNESEKDKDDESPVKIEEKKSVEMASEKEHECAEKCKDENHLYAHGEKEHSCSDECMKES